MKLQTGVGRVQLEVKGRGLHGLLLLACHLCEAVRKCVGNQEFHQFTRKTFITSSPRWLMTLTAILPDCGLSNGREVSLCRDSQASSLISALSVVLSDLY